MFETLYIQDLKPTLNEQKRFNKLEGVLNILFTSRHLIVSISFTSVFYSNIFVYINSFH